MNSSVDGAERLGLLVPQRRLAEVAEVRDADAVEREREDRVRSALGAGLGVVLGRDPGHVASCVPAVRTISGSPPMTSTAL